MSLIKDLLEHPGDLPITSKYTAMNGLIYLVSGALLIIWPGVVQTIFRDAAFVGNEARRRERIGQSSSRSIGARAPGHRGNFSSFSTGVCGSRPNARHWRLAASPSIGPPSTSLDRWSAIAVAVGTAPGWL